MPEIAGNQLAYAGDDETVRKLVQPELTPRPQWQTTYAPVTTPPPLEYRLVLGPYITANAWLNRLYIEISICGPDNGRAFVSNAEARDNLPLLLPALEEAVRRLRAYLATEAT